jgi:hypothetical protein
VHFLTRPRGANKEDAEAVDKDGDGDVAAEYKERASLFADIFL